MLNGREKDGFTYPVAMYDHDEGQAVTDGFAYHGRIAALRGKFVFGDIQNGRLFAADLAEMKKADDGIPQTVAPIEEIQLYVRDASGNRIGCVDAGARRSNDGREPPARRSAYQPHPRRRAAPHVEAGRHDPDARSGFNGHRVGTPATLTKAVRRFDLVVERRNLRGRRARPFSMPLSRHIHRYLKGLERSADRYIGLGVVLPAKCANMCETSRHGRTLAFACAQRPCLQATSVCVCLLLSLA